MSEVCIEARQAIRDGNFIAPVVLNKLFQFEDVPDDP